MSDLRYGGVPVGAVGAVGDLHRVETVKMGRLRRLTEGTPYHVVVGALLLATGASLRPHLPAIQAGLGWAFGWFDLAHLLYAGVGGVGVLLGRGVRRGVDRIGELEAEVQAIRGAVDQHSHTFDVTDQRLQQQEKRLSVQAEADARRHKEVTDQVAEVGAQVACKVPLVERIQAADIRPGDTLVIRSRGLSVDAMGHLRRDLEGAIERGDLPAAKVLVIQNLEVEVLRESSTEPRLAACEAALRRHAMLPGGVATLPAEPVKVGTLADGS